MANTSAYVSTGKPNIAGAIYAAPAGTTLPTDATTALDPAFVCLGFVSEDGLENDNEMDIATVKAWGGSIIYRSLTELTDNFSLTLIESENPEVLKAVYGDKNVTVEGSMVTVKVVAENPTEKVFVFELALRGDKKKRIVVPVGAVTERGTISYNDEDPIGYEITISAYPDENGSTHTEYMTV